MVKAANEKVKALEEVVDLFDIDEPKKSSNNPITNNKIPISSSHLNKKDGT